MSRPRRPDPVTTAARLLVELLRRTTPRQRLRLLLLAAVVLISVGLYRWWTSRPAAPPVSEGGTSAEAALQVYFTNPDPTGKAQHQGGIDEHLVALMDRAQKTLDVCVYDFDLTRVATAMADAQRRGVRVRMVTDSDTLKKAKTLQAFTILQEADIPIVGDSRNALMHDKFTIVDGEWVQTGSWNYTVADTYRLNNNLLIIHSSELAENYTAEFEKMFVHGRFGAKKSRGVPHPVVTVNGATIRTYFAPKDQAARHVVEALEKAEKNIFFLVFQFTHDGIGRVVREKAAAGLEVRGVFEKRNNDTPHSEYGKLKDAGIDVRLDGNPYTMHHKVFIIDGRTVICGSFNFSDSADKENDENLLLIEDERLAREFQAEFDRVYEWALHPPKRK